MKDRSGLCLGLLVCAVALTRWAFRSHYLYDVDSVDFALALRRFDPTVFQPHPPGYFLYVCLGRLVNRLIPDVNSALVAISVVASCGAAIVIYLLTRSWYGSRSAIAAVVLFLCSPLCWFHGIVGLTYIVEAFFSGLVGYLCWKVYVGADRFAVPASVALAVATGFRPSIGLFLGPLWLASVWGIRVRHRLLALLAIVLGVLAWFVPMSAASGGITPYFSSLVHLWTTVPGRRTALSNPALAVARLFTIAWIVVLCFGAASLFVIRGGRGLSPATAGWTKFLWIWISPGLLFFTFIFLNYVNSGYLLVLCPPMFSLLGTRVYDFIGVPRQRALRWTGAAAGVAVNCAFFLYAPVYCSHRGIREFECEMRTVVRDFAQGVDPKKTLIVGFDAHFLGYRHAGYYLPAFVTVQYPEVAYPDGKRVFVMHGRDTHLARSIPAGFERFVFFPLPSGREYAEYLERVIGELPEGTLSTTSIGRETVLSGPASALELLFRSTANASEALYTPLHQGR